MTETEAIQYAIDQLEADAEATESDEDAGSHLEAAAVLRSLLPTVAS